MKKILDYNYYLFAEKFYAIEKEKVIFYVTVIQYLFVVNFTLFIILRFKSVAQFFPFIIVFCLLVFFGLRFYNRKKYKGKFLELELNWKKETEDKKSFYKKLIWGLVLLTFCLMIINAQFLPSPQ